MDKIDKLIINTPYSEPTHYWSYDRETRSFSKAEGRRPAGYVIASETSRSFDDPGIFREIALVNTIRPRIKKWRDAGYPGVSGITKRLLEHWNNTEARQLRFFFCQLEAMETLIWLTESPESEKVGIDLVSDGGSFTRLCSKMATGSGKTIVMAKLIAWQVLNKVTYPQDSRFSKNIFIVAPGLTVKSRLQVLQPFGEGNFYDEFNIIPGGLLEKLRQGKIIIKNWHALNWDTDEKLAKRKSVDKRGAKSDEAYVREVLDDMSSAKNILVINDEAHHAWRVPAESKVKGLKREEIEEATKWVGGLDRINRARGILCCYDFSATPFVPTGKKTSEESLFGWIVSDFGLNDAIESGLVKTPRVVVRDDAVPDAQTYKSKLYHIYEHVKDDLTQKSEEYVPLPDLVNVAYYILGKDWLATYEDWKKSGHTIPPVMITVANTTFTAARIKFAFDRKKIMIDELCDPDKTLHIDSKVLSEAEAKEEAEDVVEEAESVEEEDADVPKVKLSKQKQAELLRQKVDTVGKPGKQGEQIRKVISVGMLSEGWDAKTVTHIMGLRAFTSQLLCEQVVGRGLRRTSYEVNEEGMFEAEYVNIFGVPFTFLPHETQDGPPPPPQPPKTAIEPVKDKQRFEIKWPNIIRIDHVYTPQLKLDLNKVKSLQINAYDTPTLVQIAPTIEGKPDLSKISEIDLQKLGEENRYQRIIFTTARDVYDQMQPAWKGDKSILLAQLIRLVEQFINSNIITINPPLFFQEDIKRRILITLNMNKIVNHIFNAIRWENTQSITPVFDSDKPIKSTADMRTWYTSKPCEFTDKSHINFCVFDSTWESTEAFQLDHDSNVNAWAKNDHLGFEIPYMYQGQVHRYRPDYLVKLKDGTIQIIEVKGQTTEQDKVKWDYLDEWVRAVNEYGSFGVWKWGVVDQPQKIIECLVK